MLKFIKFTGQNNSNGNRLAEFECECGSVGVYSFTRAKNGYVSNCKKCASKKSKEKNTKHGMRKSSEYRSWISIKDRCLNKNSKDYKRYGGSGIKICEEWANSFSMFFNHIGKKPSNKHSVDRIDNYKGYEPGNVRWATTKEQSLNKKNTVFVTDEFGVYHISDVANKLGITRGAAYMRLKRGKLNGFAKNT